MIYLHKCLDRSDMVDYNKVELVPQLQTLGGLATQIINEMQRGNRELKVELKKVQKKGDDTARKVNEILSIMTEFMKILSVPNAHSNNQDQGDNSDISGSNNHIEDL